MASRASKTRVSPRVVAVALGLAAGPLAGQEGPVASQVPAYTSREVLGALIARLEAAMRSPAYSQPLKSRAQALSVEARSRLEQGDFQAGDRILLVVQGESALTDTFTVGQAHELTLPLVGPISLSGVLRSELASHLTAQLARRIRAPRVQVHTMVRVAIEGAVLRPGFYSVSAGALLGDALMAAGGLTSTAVVEGARVERSGRAVLSTSAFRQAVTGGRTLDQLDVRPGDHIVVPQRGSGAGGAEGRLRTVTTLLGIPLTIFAVTRIF